MILPCLSAAAAFPFWLFGGPSGGRSSGHSAVALEVDICNHPAPAGKRHRYKKFRKQGAETSWRN